MASAADGEEAVGAAVAASEVTALDQNPKRVSLEPDNLGHNSGVSPEAEGEADDVLAAGHMSKAKLNPGLA